MLETSSTSLGGQVPSPKSFVSQGEYTGDGVRGIVDVGDTEAEASGVAVWWAIGFLFISFTA